MTADWVGQLAATPWAVVLLGLVTVVDGFFPPVPSESAVVALAALGASGRGPGPVVVGVVAALGAFAGDQVAYTLGSRLPAGGRGVVRSRHGRQVLAWAEGALARRGGVLILAARFTPGGRVLVNMTAGAVGFPRGRFSAIAALAAVLWATGAVLLGVGAGHLLADHHPLVGMAVGVAGGLLVGLVVDRVLRLRAAAGRRPAPRRVPESAPCARCADPAPVELTFAVHRPA
jgi:membrane protein DedA with SNARE-associated domain